MVEGLIFDTKQFSIHDGPGIRTTVFLKGCNLRCPWCHNPEGRSSLPELMLDASRCIQCGGCLAVCPVGIEFKDGKGIPVNRQECLTCGLCTEVCYAEARRMVGERVSAGDVFQIIKRDLPFFKQSGGGVTFSGGEPLLQPEFLKEILLLCRQEGIHTVLDTTGYADWSVLEKVNPLVDLYLYDIKFMEEKRHLHWTGVSNRKILDNVQRLVQAGARIIIRRPVLPGINDSRSQIQRLVDFLVRLGGVERVDLLPYHNLSGQKSIRLTGRMEQHSFEVPSQATLSAHRSMLAAGGLSVSVGG